ncbi:SPFH domain-containing protein [Streptomyces sp. NBC_01262]|uniref:SPFH domain-containing protein n=1 Tax=Streptomyces sp. NBC_01262 TaxID=2903803 RepID=UPI002E35502F|nr:SPFH domain-containing protein [Streptomyces sp. NBC_01262]
MGIFDRIRGEFIDIVEWTDDSRDTIVWRFPRHGNEIKMGARLVVRESQTAVFVNEGRIADVFQPGTYTLRTQNLPVLSTLKGWKHGFASPFKAEVYFVSSRQFTDLKWGTRTPVIVRDAEFGMVRLRAFGGFALRVSDPAALLRELAGTDPQFRTEEVQEYLRQLIVGRLAGALGAAGVPVLDLAAQQDRLGGELAGILTEELASVGIAVPKFVIESISLPEEVEKAVDAAGRMNIVGDLNRYTQIQTADALRDAAANPGGGAGEGLGLGLGLAAGQRMAGALAPQPAPAAPATPAAPAAPATPAAPVDALSVPPPLPVTDGQWHVGLSGGQEGPYDSGRLAAMIAEGTLTRATLVWQAGMAAWTSAGELPALERLFAAVPPPLPPLPPQS